MSETLAGVKQVVALTMGVAPEAVTEDSTPDTIHSWDSMSHLNLMLALEEHFGVDLDPDAIDEMTKVSQIVGVIDGLKG